MRPRPVVLAALVAAGCATPGPGHRNTAPAPQLPSAGLPPDATADSRAREPPVAAAERETTTSAALVVVVPPLPIDLAVPGRGDHGELAIVQLADDHTAADPDDRHGDAAVAAAFTVAVYTRRHDSDPAVLRTQLAAVVGTEHLAAAAASVPGRAAGELATWPIIAAVEPDGDRWWRVTATLKTTRHGQQGPRDQPLMLRVHVAAGRVDAWQLPQ